MKRCDFCELPVGGGCACALPQEGPGSRARAGGTKSADGALPPAAILISPRGVAHRTGCMHQSDSEITAPRWGWVPDPDPQLWRRISEGNPVHATHGNTERRATQRCQSCDT